MDSVGDAVGNNMTTSGNSTETSLCSLEKKPETTQECGASSTKTEDAKPTQDVTSEVN